MGRQCRMLEVQIAKLISKVKQKRAHATTTNRDDPVSPLSRIIFFQFSLNYIFLDVEVNIIPPHEQDQMEEKPMITPDL